jgi:G3E family GTPase
MKTTPKPIQKIPILILSGFLGSGKTTLLNRILTQVPRSAVIINEFGTTPIDQQLLREHNVPLSTLSGGCLCCQVRGALMPVLKNLRMSWESNNDKPFDRIIIETSGVANPEPVLDIVLKQNWLSKRYNLQGVIAIISALTGADTLSRYPDAQAQIAWADSIAITHTDLASPEQIQHLEAHLAELSPAANRVHVVNGEIELKRLLDFSAQYRYLRTENSADLPDHGFNSITLQFEHPVAWQHLESVLLKLIEKYGDRLVRFKGLIFDPEFDHPLLVQGSVGILYPPAHLPIRESDDFISRLVFIMAGAVTGLEEDVLSQLGRPSYRFDLVKS